MDARDAELPDKMQIIENPESLVRVTPIRTTKLKEVYGSTYARFSKSLSVKVGMKGSFGGFSASLDTEFDEKSMESTTTKFLKLHTTVSGSVLSIGEDLDVLKANLTPRFKTALANNTAKALIRAYGTHLVTKVDIGGRAELFCSSSATERTSETNFKLQAKAAYKGVGGSIDASVGITASEERLAKKVGGSKRLNVLGGSARERSALRANKPNAWENWAATIENNPGFLGYREGLIPLWELAKTARRRAELRKGFNQEAAKKPLIRVFSATGAAASHPDAKITIDDDYKLLGGGAFVRYTGCGNLLTASYPESDNTWRATSKDHHRGDAAKLTVYAVGLYDPDDFWDVVRKNKTGGKKSDAPICSVSLPAGYALVGGGAKDNWSGAGNMLTASYPKQNSWYGKGKAQLISDPSTITAYAIGIKSKIGIKVATKIQTSKSGRAHIPTANAAPTRGYDLVSGGAKTDYHYQGQFLTSSYPDGDKWTTASKDHFAPESGIVTAYAIGIKVG